MRKTKETTKKKGAISIYTDGGYSQLNNKGAWAYIILDGEKIIDKDSGMVNYESNNRAELKAIINAVASLPNNTKATIYSDSKYAIGILSGTWSAKANTDLVAQWMEIRRTKQPQLIFQWIKGHNGNKYNEMCDKMCNDVAGIDLNNEIDLFREPSNQYRYMSNYELLAELEKNTERIGG